MNARDETDMDGDSRLVEALRSLSKPSSFSLGAEIAKANEQWNQGARIADDCFCRHCGVRGHTTLCSTCQREANQEGRFTWGE